MKEITTWQLLIDLRKTYGKHLTKCLNSFYRAYFKTLGYEYSGV